MRMVLLASRPIFQAQKPLRYGHDTVMGPCF